MDIEILVSVYELYTKIYTLTIERENLISHSTDFIEAAKQRAQHDWEIKLAPFLDPEILERTKEVAELYKDIAQYEEEIKFEYSDKLPKTVDMDAAMLVLEQVHRVMCTDNTSIESCHCEYAITWLNLHIYYCIICIRRINKEEAKP